MPILLALCGLIVATTATGLLGLAIWHIRQLTRRLAAETNTVNDLNTQLAASRAWSAGHIECLWHSLEDGGHQW